MYHTLFAWFFRRVGATPHDLTWLDHLQKSSSFAAAFSLLVSLSSFVVVFFSFLILCIHFGFLPLSVSIDQLFLRSCEGDVDECAAAAVLTFYSGLPLFDFFPNVFASSAVIWLWQLFNKAFCLPPPWACVSMCNMMCNMMCFVCRFAREHGACARTLHWHSRGWKHKKNEIKTVAISIAFLVFLFFYCSNNYWELTLNCGVCAKDYMWGVKQAWN